MDPSVYRVLGWVMLDTLLMLTGAVLGKSRIGYYKQGFWEDSEYS